MATRIAKGEGERMGLPGRSALEIASGKTGGASVTFRHVEIPVPKPGESLRAPHLHQDFEEIIYVAAGQGLTCTQSEEFPVGPGDTMVIPAGELHVTRNTGNEPLVLLCFFPIPDIAPGTRSGSFTQEDS